MWATDAQVPTQSERSNDPSPAPTPLPLLKLCTKLSPRRTFSPLLPAAYQRAASRAPPPVCPCRPGWTRAGRSSAGPGGLSGTRRCRRECPGRRERRWGEVRGGWVLALFTVLRDAATGVFSARCSQWRLFRYARGEAGEPSVRVQCREMVMHAALQRSAAGKVLMFWLQKINITI